MCSLLNFPPPCGKGQMTVCELESQMQTRQGEDGDISRPNIVASYPEIRISKEMIRPSASKESAKSAFLPYDETPLKRAAHAWYEQGWTAGLEELTCSKERERIPRWLSSLARGVLALMRWTSSLNSSLFPHLMLSSEEMITSFSSTRDWANSLVRCLAWHPHCTKLAVAVRDDSIRVYSTSSTIRPILKYKLQKGVSCMAWKPFSASKLAVGCQAGVLVWHIDPSSMVTRPSASCVTVLSQSGHAPVTSLTWSPQGSLLLSASAADTSMIVWNVAMETFVPMRRVGGGGVSLISWSPDGSKVFTATPSTIFRVWETNQWTHERWLTVSGHVQAACWSSCGTILLFCTSNEPTLYSLQFTPLAEGSGPQATGGAKSALPVADLTAVSVGGGEDDDVRVGGSVLALAWDRLGERLAVMFRESELIAVFRTRTKPSFVISPCGFIRGAPGEVPVHLAFQNNFDSGALLTVAWSGGQIQYFPMLFIPGSTALPNGHISLDASQFGTSYGTPQRNVLYSSA